MHRHLLAALLALSGALAGADTLVTEVIPLRHTVLGEVLPMLQQLVAEGGTVTGMHDQLVIRTTPDNLADLKQVLASFDRAPRQLRITVRQDIDSANQLREDALSARIRAGDVRAGIGGPGGGPGASIGIGGEDGRITYRNLSTRTEQDAANTHFVTTLEGSPAFIHAGQAVPLADRSVAHTPWGVSVYDSVRYRDVGAGFYVTPRVVGGDRVSLEISPYADRLAQRGGGAIDTRGLSTLASGRLGEWIPLGGAAQSSHDAAGGILYRTRQSGHDVYDVWVKVELVP